MKTQLEQIKQHLVKHKSITSWTAITKYRITRLSHYILVLRKKGVNIQSQWMQSDGKRWVVYRLKK